MRTALLIATDTYADPAFSALASPEHDAVELDRVLSDPSIGEFTTEVLVNRPVELLRTRLESVFTNAGWDDFLLLYLSGHGVKDRTGRLFFPVRDTRAGLLGSSALDARFVRDLVNHSRARQVVVLLDCCYGGAFPSGMLPRAAGNVDVVDQLDGGAGGSGCVVMTAATHIQYAFEPGGRRDGDPEPSVFTKAVVDGLRTGDAALDGDGEITARELYGYVYERVRRESPDQTPTSSGTISGELRIAHAGASLPGGVPDELRRLLRSADPALRRLGARELGARAAAGDHAAAVAMRLLASGTNPDLAKVAREVLTSSHEPLSDASPAVPERTPPTPDPAPPALPDSQPTRPPADLGPPETAPAARLRQLHLEHRDMAEGPGLRHVRRERLQPGRPPVRHCGGPARHRPVDLLVGRGRRRRGCGPGGGIELQPRRGLLGRDGRERCGAVANGWSRLPAGRGTRS
ncbi:caspase family protein [Actinosynnema sp. NPDC050436]|uniref:caspase family protein n=1 Tax=Actinosynnema sp. NPDC050436 TaxID=3155659 RepID=UPI0033DB44D8